MQKATFANNSIVVFKTRKIKFYSWCKSGYTARKNQSEYKEVKPSDM